MLFERYYQAIERFFVNKVSVEVGDLVQQTFIACVEGRERIRDGCKFRSYWEQMGVADMAEMLDLPRTTVRSRLYLARRCLLEQLEGLEPSAIPGDQLPLDKLDSWARACRREMEELTAGP